jgi:hypothetical protein
LLLSHSHSCSFSNLPRGLQQLLNSGDGTHKRRKSRHKHRAHAQAASQQQQVAGLAAGPQQLQPQHHQPGVQDSSQADKPPQASRRVDSLVFGDMDSSVYRRLSSDSAAGGSSTAAAAAATTAGGDGSSESGSSSSSDGDESDTSSTSSSSRRVSGTGTAGAQGRSEPSEEGSEDASGEEEGPSLRSQLLLGHLLLLASKAVSGSAVSLPAAAGAGTDSSITGSSTVDTAFTTAPAAGGAAAAVSSSSTLLRPAELQVLAGHLRRSGLLPKWVYWLLRQLPQRPELYERAFNRLFRQVGGGRQGRACAWLCADNLL